MKKLYTANSKNLKPILLLVLVMLLALSPTTSTYGQVITPFTPRSSVFTPNQTLYNIKGDFTMLGNTNLTLVNYSDSGNNSSDMKYVDIDNDPFTFNSSSADLTFSNEFGSNPDCSNIVYAGLYWTGRSTATNTFTVTKDVSTGNTVPRPVTTNRTMYNGEAIPNTNYTLTQSVSGSVTSFKFTSSDSGNTVEFFYNSTNSSSTRYLRVSVNGGPQTNVATTSLNTNNAYLSAPYTVFTSPDYTLTVTRLRLQDTDRAYVVVTHNEMVPEIIPVTKTFDKRKVSIKGPTASSYTELTANSTDIYYPQGAHGDMYSAYIDVTDYVRNNGKNGTYHVADLALTEGNGGSTGYYGGWGMVVVYENSEMPWKDITVFDGHGYVAGSTTVNHKLDVSGFNSAQNGPVNLKLGVMAGEGDRDISGDYFKIQRQIDNNFETLSHSGNEGTNFFNSSILTEGTRLPSLLNNTGLDISIFDLDNIDNTIITNNQTSTQFEFGTTQDTFVIFNITFSVDAYIPESEGLLSLHSIGGNAATAPYVALPGEHLEYGLEIRNKGTEAIVNAKLVLPIPFTSEFVPGSITFNEYDSLFDATAPYFDPNEGATGSIVWDIAYLPLDTDLTKLLANIRFRLKSTEDCSILINNDCAPKIVILGGYIAGTGENSLVQYSLPLIQGYQDNGACEGEPNTNPIEVNLDAEQYIIDNCTGVSIEREFLYCSLADNGVPVSEIQAQFPPGSLFYDSYPVTDNSIQYTATNPFPATINKVTYYAVPPGLSTCSYIFTIEVTEITSSPSVSDVIYCLNETAQPLTAQASNTNYTLFYYTDNNPSTIGQTSLIPDTSVTGVFTYYVSEGPAANCVNSTRTPITVTVNDSLTITLEEQVNNSCADLTSGSINISISGGSGNYTFDWDHNGLEDPDTDTKDLSNLADGTYTVIVSDAETNCSATASFIIITENTGSVEITAPTALNINGCTIDDITNGGLTALAYSEDLVTISTAEFLAEGGTFNGDNITNVTYSDSSTGECPLVITRTFSVTDACSQTATSTQVISIENNVAPTLVAPQDVTLECEDSTDPSFTGTATISDTCGTSAITFEDVTTSGTCEGSYTITRTWTAIDACGNTASASQTINVQDTTAPIIAALPAESTIECSVTPEFAQAIAIDGCDTDVTLTFEDVTTSGACEGEYSITRTWTATDACGNTATASQTINVQDTTAPVIAALPADSTIDCSVTPEFAQAIATDGCGSEVTLTFAEVTTPGTCAGEFSITRTWTATDACGNAATASQTINVQDTTAPIIAALPADSTIDCSVTPEFAQAIATDGCGSEVTLTFADVTTPGTCAGEFSITRTWTATDACGNASSASQTINVQDTTAPVIAALPAESTIDCSVTPEFAQAIATDGCGSEVTLTFDDVTTPGTCAGEFSITRTWTATDACGNAATASQTINMIDNVDPILIMPSDITVECSESTDPAATGNATATDTCGTATIIFQDLFEESCGNTQIITRIWTATDECGNTASDTQIISVVDTTPPVLTIPADITMECSGLSRMIGEATATDGCGRAFISFEDSVVEGCGVSQVISRTWTATDECGNSVSEVQTISIIDNTPPTITIPADTTVECSESTDPLATGTATGDDMCGSVQVTFEDVINDGSCGNTQTITRTWTITDECGNTISESQIITVVDTTAPVIVNPASDIVIECDSNGNNGTIEAWLNSNGGATATDTCSSTLTWTNNYNGATSDCSTPIEVIFTVTDACGNSASTSATYAIQDVFAPEVTPAMNLTVECDGQGNTTDLETWLNGNAGATAFDDCSTVTWSNDFNGLSDDCGSTGQATVTFTATDSCGNSSSTTAIFKIVDTTAPVIDSLPAEITVDCSVTPEFAQATATDACSNDDITLTFEDVTIIGACEGSYAITRTWTATDACGNTSTASQTINVQDTTAPVIAELPAETTVDSCSVTPEFAQAIATDACGSEITLTFEDIKTVGECEGSYTITRTWTATDTCGNASTASQTINVQDTTAPVIAELPAETTVDSCSEIPEFTQATATDACSNDDISLTFEDVTTVGECEGDYSITRTWTATDACGNVSTASQTINVKDQTAPNLVTPYEAEITISCDNIPAIPELVFEDACSENIEVAFNETSTAAAGSLQYVITRTWTVSDICNNEAVFTQIINVNNTATVIAADTELCNDDNLNFDLFDLLSGSYATNGTWSVVAGNATLNANFFNPYRLELGTYTFMYTVSDDYCTSETLVNITLNDDCVVLPCGAEDVIISKAVTTYADGKNDFFTVTGVESCGFVVELQIFNRWGAMIYESNNYQNDWNGSSSKASIGNSNYVPTGTYYYVINLKNSGLKPFAGPIYVATK